MLFIFFLLVIVFSEAYSMDQTSPWLPATSKDYAVARCRDNHDHALAPIERRRVEPTRRKQATVSKSIKEQYEFLEAVQSGLIAQVKQSIDYKKVDINAVIPGDTYSVEVWAQEVTPLYLSVRVQEPIITSLLLTAGAQVNIPCGLRVPLLHLAVTYALGCKNTPFQEFESKLQMVDLLLAYGADYTAQQRIHSQDTIFHQIARALVAQNGGVASVVFDRLVQGIVTAARTRKDKSIQKLLSTYMLKNEKGCTAIDVACCERCTQDTHGVGCKRYYFDTQRLYCLKE